MNLPKKNSKNLTILFFTGYVLLMVSMIAGVTLVDLPNINEGNTVEKVNPTFEEALAAYEQQQAEKKAEQEERKWKVSNEFVMIAVTIGAVLDVIIIVIWAKTQNRKLKEAKETNKRKWLYSKVFWNIVALGVIQPKEKQLVINWYNLIGVTILIHLFFYFLFMN
ncbi:hypothetical protein [Niallia endozanthoxylica]|uniref:Uncharacterized protein n=1 Tax=Niallia endozanthoxylica TaxID=2036016 RepID=A0A5J5HL66_9BACI|nr:hypothetical protein [Niallia endozanthoxylica]KAA9021071.1 hypothetical protein F4V44_18180 [Niallia endozanthoxylica]